MDPSTQNFLIIAGGFCILLFIQYMARKPGKSTVQGNPDDAVFIYDGMEYDADERTDLNRYEFELKLKNNGQHVNTVRLTDDEVVPLRTREAIVPSPGMRRRWIRRAERDKIVGDLFRERNKVFAELADTKIKEEVDGTEHERPLYEPERVEDRAWEIMFNKIANYEERIIDLEREKREVSVAYATKTEELTNKIVNQNEERKEFVGVASDVLKAKAASSQNKPMRS